MCFAILLFTLYKFSENPGTDADFVLVWSMTGLSFPSSVLVIYGYGSLSIYLSEAFSLQMKNSYASLTLLWLLFFAIGYLQWFKLVPLTIRAVKRAVHRRTADEIQDQ